MAEELLTKKSVILLKKSVAVRFEHNFNNGTLILIDTACEKLWFGNTETVLLIKKLRFNRKRSIEEIFTEILAGYNECDYEQVLSSLNDIVNNLYNEGFVSIIK